MSAARRGAIGVAPDPRDADEVYVVEELFEPAR